MGKRRILIMGAAGRDFHNFNVAYRSSSENEVIAFTATQIPKIAGRKYPAELAGPHYPHGIPILPEKELASLIQEKGIDEVVFSYSDVSHEYVMQKGSIALAYGADYKLLSPRHTWLQSKLPVIAVCAVRTGCGKSQTSRKIVEGLIQAGKKVVAIRHPMPYGNLVEQACQRFSSYEDLKKHDCTIEEREEYEPYISRGLTIFAGVDYEKILSEAEKEADILIWDGGNNDTPFIKPDLFITVVDPLRAGHERLYHPGETNFLMAHVLVINKYKQANPEQIQILMNNIQKENPKAILIQAASKITVEDPEKVRGKKVLVIEDGPTLTHGGMSFGAGVVAAQENGAAEIIDPRPYAKGSIKEAYTKYPQMGPLIPALGYYPKQLKELEETIRKTPCDTVLIASPIDIRQTIAITQDAVRVGYDLEEIGSPNLQELLTQFLSSPKKGGAL